MSALGSIVKSLILMILPKFLARVFYTQKELVWIVHPRNTKDIVKKLRFLKGMSDKAVFNIVRRIPPFLVSNFENGSVKAYMVGIPVSPQILGSKDKAHIKFSVKKTRQALRMAEKLGAKSISLGGFLTSVVSKNNLEEEFDLEFYDGTRLLSRLSMDKIDRIISDKSIDKITSTIAVIGATTKTGSLISELLSQTDFKRIYLFGKTPANLENLKKRCIEINPSANINISTDLSELSESDINILTAYITTEEEITNYLKKNSVFLGAIEPISPFVFELEKSRPDVEIHKGISVNTPDVVYDGYDLGLPKGNSFVCVTEALMFAGSEEKASSVYENNLDTSVSKVKNLFSKLRFTSS